MTHEETAKALLQELWHRAQGDKIKTVVDWKDECTPLLTAALRDVEQATWERAALGIDGQPAVTNEQRRFLNIAAAYCRAQASQPKE